MLRPFGLLAKGGPALWIFERLYVLFLHVRPVLQKLAR